MRSFHNRQNRKSGGYKKLNIYVPVMKGDKPVLTIQCFERRHNDCSGIARLFTAGAKCECNCHKLSNQP